MLHILLLGVFTAAVATLTFALLALASMASAGYRSNGLRLARSAAGATAGTPPNSGVLSRELGAAPASGLSSSPCRR